MVDEHVVLHRRTEPLTAEVDGETVMFHPGNGTYFALGSVGSRVWELLEEPRSVPDLCDQLRTEFEVDEETCRRDVVEFVDQLLDAQLVEARP